MTVIDGCVHVVEQVKREELCWCTCVVLSQESGRQGDVAEHGQEHISPYDQCVRPEGPTEHPLPLLQHVKFGLCNERFRSGHLNADAWETDRGRQHFATRTRRAPLLYECAQSADDMTLYPLAVRSDSHTASFSSSNQPP